MLEHKADYGRNTWLYQAPVEVWEEGALTATYQNRVSVRTRDSAIVTAYITRK